MAPPRTASSRTFYLRIPSLQIYQHGPPSHPSYGRLFVGDRRFLRLESVEPVPESCTTRRATRIARDLAIGLW
ncbi:hypothetical protein PanWU01x14_293150, partial [Parasponia andersonii]